MKRIALITSLVAALAAGGLASTATAASGPAVKKFHSVPMVKKFHSAPAVKKFHSAPLTGRWGRAGRVTRDS